MSDAPPPPGPELVGRRFAHPTEPGEWTLGERFEVQGIGWVRLDGPKGLWARIPGAELAGWTLLPEAPPAPASSSGGPAPGPVWDPMPGLSDAAVAKAFNSPAPGWERVELVIPSRLVRIARRVRWLLGGAE